MTHEVCAYPLDQGDGLGKSIGDGDGDAAGLDGSAGDGDAAGLEDTVSVGDGESGVWATKGAP